MDVHEHVMDRRPADDEFRYADEVAEVLCHHVDCTRDEPADLVMRKNRADGSRMPFCRRHDPVVRGNGDLWEAV